MKVIDSSEARTIQLSILGNIIEFCDKNDLKYYLWGGTLLGAIRHNGFIPWDDDIDIAMPRKDYEFFVANFHSERYGVVSCENNIHCPFWFAKAYDKQTIKCEPIFVSKALECGVDVDIFPLDMVGDKNMVLSSNRKRKWLKFWWRWSIYKYIAVPNALKNTKRIFISSCVSVLRGIGLLNANRIAKKINRMATHFSGTDENLMLYADSNIANPLMLEKEWYKASIKHVFEDKNANIPIGYHEVLCACYGDYMTPPPPEKQVTHHTNTLYWRDKE